MSDFKNATVYQIYVKSFMDSNGDGIGDLKGITSQLDYLASLGVDYLWLTPFFLSPLRDNGYDVADYLSIDPVFGNMDELEELIAKAEEKGLGLMLDMVFNHTSTEHEWFKKALTGDEKYLAYYKFVDGHPDQPPTNWVSKFGGSAWHYVPHLGKWYLHLFDVTQADLNWDNPEVREELKQVIRFWKSKGIKGFRFDVVNLISKPAQLEDDEQGDGRRFYTDGPHVHEYLKELVRDTGLADDITVGEMSSTSIANCIRYSNPDEGELSMVFSFHHLKVDYLNGEKWALMPPDLTALKRLFTDWQLGMLEGGGWNALFWCNHDQPRAVSRFGDDQNYHRESAKMLAACIHLMRGTPYIYQGEEIGMTNAYYETIESYQDVESLNYYEILLQAGKTQSEALGIISARSRDNGRTPMQWGPGPNADFSSGKPWLTPAKNYCDINVQKAQVEENGILQFYKTLVELRKTLPVIAYGNISFIEQKTAALFCFKRNYESKELVVLNNLSKEAVFLDEVLDLEAYSCLLSSYDDKPEQKQINELRPFESLCFYKK